MSVKEPKQAPGLRPYNDEDFKKRRYDVLMHYSIKQLANFLGASFNEQFVRLLHENEPAMSINDWEKWLSEEAESWELPPAHR